MKLLAFALFDSKASFFHTPFFMNHRGQALRAMMDLVQDMSTTVARHPADFHLYEIGEYDDQTGLLAPFHPISLGACTSFLPPPAPSSGGLFPVAPVDAI